MSRTTIELTKMPAVQASNSYPKQQASPSAAVCTNNVSRRSEQLRLHALIRTEIPASTASPIIATLKMGRLARNQLLAPEDRMKKLSTSWRQMNSSSTKRIAAKRHCCTASRPSLQRNRLSALPCLAHTAIRAKIDSFIPKNTRNRSWYKFKKQMWQINASGESPQANRAKKNMERASTQVLRAMRLRYFMWLAHPSKQRMVHSIQLGILFGRRRMQRQMAIAAKKSTIFLDQAAPTSQMRKRCANTATTWTRRGARRCL